MTPFTMQRRTSWGDCDPARIYYTPQAVYFAVEAVEAWYQEVLGVSWGEMAERHDHNVRFVHVDCDYHRPLVASQVVHMQVWVVGVERSSVTFSVIGKSGDGALCFLARLVGCFVERNSIAALPLPEEISSLIDAYRKRCGDVTALAEGGNRSALLSGHRTETVDADDLGCCSCSVGAVPFTRQRRVVYGDCDVSGTVSAPRILNYAIETIEEWYEEVPGVSWMDLVCKRRQGAPFVSVSSQYLRPMTSGQTITISVWVTRLGGASIEFAVFGCDPMGAPLFNARLVACFIDQSGFKTIRIPEVFRTRIQSYQSSCETFRAGRAALV